MHNADAAQKFSGCTASRRAGWLFYLTELVAWCRPTPSMSGRSRLVERNCWVQPFVPAFEKRWNCSVR